LVFSRTSSPVFRSAIAPQTIVRRAARGGQREGRLTFVPAGGAPSCVLLFRSAIAPQTIVRRAARGDEGDGRITFVTGGEATSCCALSVPSSSGPSWRPSAGLCG